MLAFERVKAGYAGRPEAGFVGIQLRMDADKAGKMSSGVLSVTIVLLRVRLPPHSTQTKIPPPAKVAVFCVMTLLVIVADPAVKIAPPSPPRLPEKVLFSTVRSPELEIAPPSPRATVTFLVKEVFSTSSEPLLKIPPAPKIAVFSAMSVRLTLSG